METKFITLVGLCLPAYILGSGALLRFVSFSTRSEAPLAALHLYLKKLFHRISAFRGSEEDTDALLAPAARYKAWAE